MKLKIVLVLLGALMTYSAGAAEDQNLPDLGDASSGLVTLPQEHQIGQSFLRALRAQVPTLQDPILQEYLELLLYQLAEHSELQDRRLYPLLIRSPMINAFAAPGGVVGVNHGLFLNGETIHETSAILAHELAHLSQRHYARGVEAGKKAGVVTLAGLLASAILLATVGGDAGMAAMTTTQGLAQSQQLSYSRNRESEADRVGINTLARADMDPRAMAYMFERLDKATRYSGDRIPEFLRTHPVTRDRIADSYNQTQNYPRQPYPLDLDYQMMRARARALSADSAADAILYFQAGLNETDPVLRDANQYGLVLALTRNTEMDEATRHLRPLLERHPHKIAIKIAQANIHAEAQRHDQALALLEQALRISPGNYPLTFTYAEVLIANDKPVKASQVLSKLSERRPDDELVWYLLAEAYGLANDVTGVHMARAEYFVLNGNFDQAIKQLNYAMPLERRNFQIYARMQQRIEEIWNMKAARSR